MISVLGKNGNEKPVEQLNVPNQVATQKLSDQEKWTAFHKGDTEAINMVYQQNIDLMYNYGRQIVNDSEIVKDSIQEVFLRLVNSSSNNLPITSIRAYLLKSLKREILKNKKQNNKYTLADKINDESSFGIRLSDEIIPIDTQLSEKKKKFLKDSLNNLPKKQREAILLYYYEGFTYEEISHIMGVKLVKSARKLIYKAIASIKSSIRKDHIDLVFPFLLFTFIESF